MQNNHRHSLISTIPVQAYAIALLVLVCALAAWLAGCAQGADASGQGAQAQAADGTDVGNAYDTAVTDRLGRDARQEWSDQVQEQREADQEPAQDSDSSSQQPAKKPSAKELAWRDEDFEVDPSRDEWNYESNGRKVVYLTFDDGPSKLTKEFLDVLDKYDVKATFFVVGHSPEHFDMIGEAYERGHTIGLHTYSHDYDQVYSSVDAYYYDLAAIGEVVQEQIGYVPCFIRFPGGSSNMVSANVNLGIMSVLVESVQYNGYQYYDWNVSSGDGSVHTADEIAEYATEPTELSNIVLLMHDSETKQSTLDALPRIIEHYKKLGYEFEAIDRDTFVPHHGVSN